ncbi:MAG: hypothetical protein HYR96_04425, partial [Deltaproteobacteria bacterium]|nr:hypothetical protein [Deltaproteobacteria bacterium]
INFAYFGVIPLFIVVSHPAIVTNLGPWILPILFLTVCSKGVFIPFLIPRALLALYHHGRGRWMERRFFLWLTGGLLIQLGYSLALALYSHTHSMGNGSHGMGLLKSLWSAFSHLISAAGNTLFGRIYSPGHRISALLSSLAILAAIAMSWRRKRWDDLWLVLTGLTLVFGVNLLVSLKIGEWFDIAVGYFPPEGIFGRWGILPNAMVFLTIAILLARRMVTLGRAGNALFVAWLFAGGVFFPRLPTARNLSWPSVGYDAWSTLSSTIDRERPYCVPVNPYPTIVNRGCNYLEPPAFPNRFGTRQAIWPEVGILSPEKFSNQEVMLIGLPLFAPTDSSTRLEAFDREGHTLASATSSQTTGGQFTFFRFTSPLRGIHRLRLSSRQPVATLDDGTPAWVFLGVKSEKSPAGYYHPIFSALGDFYPRCAVFCVWPHRHARALRPGAGIGDGWRDHC